MQRLILNLLWCFLLMEGLSAQSTLTIENVNSISIRNSGYILDGEEIRGYFTFYVSDKVDRKTNEYTLQILDQNLQKIKSIVFEDDKNIQILESSYNGNSIMFLFYNRSEKYLEYRTYGFDGKQKSTYTREIDKRTKQLIETTYGTKSEEGSNEALFSVNNVGYTTVYPVKEGKYISYEVNFFFSNSRKQWSYEAAEEQEDKMASAVYLGATDSIILFEVLKKKKFNSQTQRSWILGLNIFNGKKVFEMPTDGEEANFYPMNISRINGSRNFLLMGTYYEPEGKISKDASSGLASWKMTPEGNVLVKKYNPWDGDISKYLPANAKGKVQDVGYIYFHKILQTEDGNFFAIGEGYKRVLDGVGIASNILKSMSGHMKANEASANFKLKITDMVMLQFNENFDVQDARIIDKNSNSLVFAAGYGFLTPHLMALIAKSYRQFDYAFTKTDKEHSYFYFGYTDYVKTDDFKGLTFNSVKYEEGKITTDQINLSSKARWVSIFPAKTGYIAILEYFKKEKKLEFHFEKLN